MDILTDKIRGSLIGGAVGDALGYAVEFISYERIVKLFGSKGITRYDLDDDGVARISDDTQMTLYTANGLLNALRDDTNDDVLSHIKQAYIEWYHTQTSDPAGNKDAKCWISALPEMYTCRAPGNTCMSALRNLSKGLDAVNNSKGCGGIMRVAPVSLMGAVYPGIFGDATRIACESAKLTHKHPLGYLPAGLMAFVIHDLISRDVDIDKHILKDSIGRGYEDLYNYERVDKAYIDELRRMTDRAIALAESDMPDIEAIRHLGEGWTGDEAWYIAIYCAFRHLDSFEDAVIAAVNHSGDSDSTGAICGNIMGAIHGYRAIPDHFIQGLELHDTIDNIVLDIISGQHIAIHTTPSEIDNNLSDAR